MSPIDVSDRNALTVQDTRRTAVRFAATIGRGTKFPVPPDPAHLLVQKSRPETFQQNVLQESSDTINRSCMKDHQKFSVHRVTDCLTRINVSRSSILQKSCVHCMLKEILEQTNAQRSCTVSKETLRRSAKNVME